MERVAEIAEDRFAAPVHHRLDHDRVLVDEVGPGQRLHESGAAPGDDLATRLRLQGRDLLGQVASVRVRENTTLGMSFMGAAYSPVAVGQTEAISR